MASAIVLQTQDNAPPGLLGVWAERRGVELDVLRVDRWDQLPDPAAYTFAAVLGSDASAAGTPSGWVARLVEWIGEADATGLPVLGICFGAQALAAGLGGGATRLPHPEHAWIELEVHDPSLITSGPWLALHEDRIEMPAGSRELARNAFGPQAFAAGPHLGVQFHPEVTPSILRRWVTDKRGAISRDLLIGVTERCATAAVHALELFDAFAERITPRAASAGVA
jgi:GMP synthase-like glutamine amidotransferase